MHPGSFARFPLLAGCLLVATGVAAQRGTVLLTLATSRSTVSTHFHAEHTAGYLAFPASAKYVNRAIMQGVQARAAYAEAP